MAPHSGEVYYRMENILVSAGVDEWDNPLGPPHSHLVVRGYRVLRRTPKGVWLQDCGRERFVLNEGRKRFACPTIEEAAESFKARKKRQLKILRNQIDHVERCLELVDETVQRMAPHFPLDVGAER